jgi:hypothetical protein
MAAMMNKVLEKLCRKDYTVLFEKRNLQTVVTARWQDKSGEWQDRSVADQNCFYALHDLLDKIGEKELVKEAATELASTQPGKRSITSKTNGKKGGRPRGSKDSYQRTRSH